MTKIEIDMLYGFADDDNIFKIIEASSLNVVGCIYSENSGVEIHSVSTIEFTKMLNDETVFLIGKCHN